MPPVEVGELLCDTLEVAEDAAFLSFIIHEGDTIVAEKSSYTVAEGDSFTDGIGRRVGAIRNNRKCIVT